VDAEVDGGSDGPVGPGPEALQAVARRSRLDTQSNITRFVQMEIVEIT